MEVSVDLRCKNCSHEHIVKKVSERLVRATVCGMKCPCCDTVGSQFVVWAKAMPEFSASEGFVDLNLSDDISKGT